MRYLLWVLLLAAPAVAQDPTPIPTAKLDRKEPISYEQDVAPIFAKKCQVCHAGNLTEGKFDMGTYAGVMKGGKKGLAVVPGKPDESPLWMRSAHRMKPIMPPKSENNPLTSEEVAVLRLWIEQGAKGPAVDIRTKAKVVVGLPPVLVKPVRALAISPDKKLIAVGRANHIHLFEATKGDFVKTLLDPKLKTPDGQPAKAAHLSLVDALAFSPDGKLLASGSFQELTLWDVDKGTIKHRVTGFSDRVMAIVFSPDGKHFATGGGAPTEDGELKIFATDTGKLVTDFKNAHSDTVYGVSFSPDGKLLASAGADKFVKVFEVSTGKFTKSFEGHTQHVLDVCWTKDGKKLVSAGADNFLKVWDYEKGEKARDINAHQKPVNRLAFVSTTGKVLSVGGDAMLKQWNPDNGGNERNFPQAKDFLYAVAVSPDGAVVVAGGEEGLVNLFNGNNGQLIKTLAMPGDESAKKK